MAGVRVTITKGSKVGKLLAAIAHLPESRGMNATIGSSLADLVRENLYKKDALPNRLNAPKTHYWREAGDSTTFQTTATGVVVSVTQIGIRQRLLGGTISAKRAKFLTIPISPEAHGKRAREFSDLQIIRSKRSGSKVQALLARVNGDDIDPLFVLKKSVKQKPDPSILPQPNVVIKTATQAAQDFLASKFQLA